MGKLQKSKKHKKIKAIDPFYKGPRTADRKAANANQAPQKIKCSEDMTYNESNIVRLKEDGKVSKKHRKNKFMKKHKDDIISDPAYTKPEKGMTRPLKPIPVFKQRRGETHKKFFNRMERQTQDVLNKARFEDKYNVEVNQTASGEVKFDKPQVGEGVPDEDEQSATSKKKKKNKKKQEKVKQIKTQKLQDRIENFEEFQDEVKFGEVAMAPPTLTAKPRQMKDLKTNRPGTKSLLLKDMVPEKTKAAPPTSKAHTSSHVHRSKGQTVKRKHMTLADQRISDQERQRAIDMYRSIKKRKQTL